MTRKSKRELERALEQLREETEPGDSVVMLAPEQSFPDDLLVNVPTEGIHVEARDGRRKVAVPDEHPRQWEGIIPLAECHVAEWWRTLSEEQLESERELREKRGEPIPPILEAKA